MKVTKFILILIVFLLFIDILSAHQPRLVYNLENSQNNPIMVQEPEISKAYYGELNGQPDYYMIKSEEKFNLYLSILSPDLEDSKTDFEVEVILDNNLFFVLNGSQEDWEVFHEEFAGDSYLDGPEIEKIVEPGIYYIKVSNPSNTGKYSLAVGKIESFPFKEIVKTFIVLPKLKKDFFEKSPLTAYFNLIGLFLLIFLVITAGIVIGIIFVVKKLKKKKLKVKTKTIR